MARKKKVEKKAVKQKAPARKSAPDGPRRGRPPRTEPVCVIAVRTSESYGERLKKVMERVNADRETAGEKRLSVNQAIVRVLEKWLDEEEEGYREERRKKREAKKAAKAA